MDALRSILDEMTRVQSELQDELHQQRMANVRNNEAQYYHRCHSDVIGRIVLPASAPDAVDESEA